MRVGFQVAALTALTMLSGAPARADLVYSQPGDGTACNLSCFTSTFDLRSNFGIQTADNFSLTQATAIGSVQWQGFYYNSVNPGNNPVSPDTEFWDISFYADSSGLPEGLLYDEITTVSSTLLGISSVEGSTVDVYSFTATLPITFDASANTTYWFGPLSFQTNFDPFFLWSAAATQALGAYSAQRNLGGPDTLWFSQPDDRAFSLSTIPATIPELSTWAMMVLGFASLGFGSYRASRKRVSVVA
jgi:hypothetical protein